MNDMNDDVIFRKLTTAMSRALVALHDGGGSGVIDRYGRIVVGGLLLSYKADTFLRLASFNLIRGRNGRLFLTDLAEKIALAIKAKEKL